MVVRQGPPPLDRVFAAMADPTRRDIVRRTVEREQSVSALAQHYPMSFAAVQKHVAVLQAADLVRKERRGREQLVSGNIEALRRIGRALDELESAWRQRLDRLDAVLAGDADPDEEER